MKKSTNELSKTPPDRRRRNVVWTPERRAAQAARLRANKIWEKSTGPRTAAGRARSRRNAVRHGRRSAASVAFRRELVAALRAQREFLRYALTLYKLCR